MERISDSTIQQVKQYGGIVECIQRYVPLKKRGRNYLGLCPFHSEKSPSFTVSPEKRIYHCFGCHASGDLINFVQEIDSVTFYEAIEIIAGYAGISVVKEQSKYTQKRQDVDLEKRIRCLREAAAFFEEEFRASSIAQTYIYSRGFNKETCEQFNVGFLSSSDKLLSVFRPKYGDEILKSSGLFVDSSNGLFCPFHHRLIFPIRDFQSRVIAFGGRLIDPNAKTAKYINSNESSHFNKRRTLYGIHRAKKSIKEKKALLLVEGYLDVLACVQYGFENVVACMGTALTSEQVGVIKRLTDSVVLMLDHDAAGLAAAKKSVDILREQGLSATVVSLDTLDPADFLMKQGTAALEMKINEAQSAFLFFYERVKSQYDLSRIENVSKCVQDMIPKLHEESDEIIRKHYVSLIAKDLGVEPETILAKLSKMYYTVPQPSGNSELFVKESKSRFVRAEEIVLAIICSDITLRGKLKSMTEELFITEENKQLKAEIFGSSKIDSDLFDEISMDRRSYLSKLMLEKAPFMTKEQSAVLFDECLSVLGQYSQNVSLKELKDQIKDLEERGGDENELNTLLELYEKMKKGEKA